MKKRVAYLTELKRIERVEELSDSDAGKLFKASLRYNDGKEINELPPSLRPLFTMMKTYFDEKFIARQLECIKQTNKIRKRRGKDPIPDTVVFRSIPQYSTVCDGIAVNTDIDKDIDIEDNILSTNVDNNKNKKENILKEKYSEDFEKFWKEYPIKKGKPKGYEAWKKALSSGVDPNKIIQKASEYATECKLKHTEERYIKRPQGRLNDGRYEDDYYTGNKKEEIDLDKLY